MHQKHEQNRNISLHTYGLYTWDISRLHLPVSCLLKRNMYFFKMY
jgi:hypothetical protein